MANNVECVSLNMSMKGPKRGSAVNAPLQGIGEAFRGKHYHPPFKIHNNEKKSLQIMASQRLSLEIFHRKQRSWAFLCQFVANDDGESHHLVGLLRL